LLQMHKLLNPQIKVSKVKSRLKIYFKTKQQLNWFTLPGITKITIRNHRTIR
jgi:hypothetical protein